MALAIPVAAPLALLKTPTIWFTRSASCATASTSRVNISRIGTEVRTRARRQPTGTGSRPRAGRRIVVHEEPAPRQDLVHDREDVTVERKRHQGPGRVAERVAAPQALQVLGDRVGVQRVVEEQAHLDVRVRPGAGHGRLPVEVGGDDLLLGPEEAGEVLERVERAHRRRSWAAHRAPGRSMPGPTPPPWPRSSTRSL